MAKKKMSMDMAADRLVGVKVFLGTFFLLSLISEDLKRNCCVFVFSDLNLVWDVSQAAAYMWWGFPKIHSAVSPLSLSLQEKELLQPDGEPNSSESKSGQL